MPKRHRPYTRSQTALMQMAFNYLRNRARGNTSTRLAHRFRNAGTQTTTRRKNMTSGQGVTDQFDRKLIYKKKRMPKRKKSKWVSFKKKVNAVAEKELGTRTIVFNKLFIRENTVVNQQALFACGLYTQESTGAGNEYLGDLSYIQAFENAGDPTAAAGETTDLTTKYIFQSGILDMTIRNTSHDAEDAS